MITEDFVSKEIAELLKEKGFDVCTKSFYKKTDQLLHHNTCALAYFGDSSTLPAPTLQSTMKWLREVHKICIVIDCDVCDSFEFYAKIYIKGEGSWITCVDYEDGGSNDYKQVAESAIEYCLTNLI